MKRFPIIHQYDTMQCGIACLQMVCKYFGREYTLESLSHICFATTEGVSLLGLNDTANVLGLHTAWFTYYLFKSGKEHFYKSPITLYASLGSKSFCRTI